MKIYINGKFVPEEKALVSIFDRGFLYGDGAFETMRAYNGEVFKLEEHIKRLLATLRALKIKPPAEIFKSSQLLNLVLKENHLENAYLRLGVTRGKGEGGFEITKEMKPPLYIIVKPFKPYPESFYQKGVKAAIVSIRKTPSSSLNSKLKTHNFLPNILAKIEAKKKGAFEGIMLDQKGYICEGAVSNIFFVKGGILFTPSTQCDILEGITRNTVLELAKKLKIPVKEGKFKTQSLYSADECFLTNSLIEILSVKKIDSFLIGNGKPGEITKVLISTYKSLVNNLF